MTYFSKLVPGVGINKYSLTKGWDGTELLLTFNSGVDSGHFTQPVKWSGYYFAAYISSYYTIIL